MPTNFKFPCSDHPIVFLPFYGEYGFYITSFVRWVHYAQSPWKIVCCERGDEILFPSAAEFYNDWENPFVDAVKCGIRDEYSFGPASRRFPSEFALFGRLSQRFPEAELAELQHHIPFDEVADFPVNLAVKETTAPIVDIVICTRRRHAFTAEGDGGQRNFRDWPKVVEGLQKYGCKIGVVGKKATSYDLPGTITASWDYSNSTEVMIDLLRRCRLYIGTDTGPTHLAALLRVPMLVFRNPADEAYNLLQMCVEPTTAASRSCYVEIAAGWNNPQVIVSEVVRFLESH